MLRRFDLLVRDVKLQTGDKAYSSTVGIRLAEWDRYGTDGQSRIFNKILGTHSSLYIKSTTMSVTQGVAEYPIPTDMHSSGNILNVFYSFNGNPINYVKLDLRTPNQEVSVNAYPTGYFLRNGNIVLTPIPSQNAAASLRLNYQYVIPDLGVRRATVSAHDTGSITFATDNVLVQETGDDLTNGLVDYVCVVDKDGTQLAVGVPVTSFNSTTNVLSCTLTAAQVSAITNGAAWVVFGANTSTHSQLIPICEPYIKHYMATAIQMRDSNSEAIITSQVLQMMEAEILASTGDLEEDITAIPISDYSFLNYSDDL